MALQPASGQGGAVSLYDRVARLSPEDVEYLRDEGDAIAIDLLRSRARTASDPEKRLRSLKLLQALDGLNHRVLEFAYQDQDSRVIQEAISVTRSNSNGKLLFLLPSLYHLATHPDRAVRGELLAFLRGIRDPGRYEPLLDILEGARGDRETSSGVLAAVEGDELVFLRRLVHRPSLGGDTIVGELIRRGLASGNGEAAAVISELIEKTPSGRHLLVDIEKGLKENGHPPLGELPLNQERRKAVLDGLVERAKVISIDAGVLLEARVRAVEELGWSSYEEVADTLDRLIDPAHPAEVQVAALSVLGEYGVDVFLQSHRAWGAFSPAVRMNALRMLTHRESSCLALLKAVQRGDFPAEEVYDRFREEFREHSDPEIARIASAVFQPEERDDHGVEDMLEFMPPPDMLGDSPRGRVYVAMECARCHRTEGLGNDFAPSLVNFLSRGEEDFLYHLFDAGHEVDPEYTMYQAYLSGTRLLGTIIAETSDSIHFNDGSLRNPERVILRSEIRRLHGSSLAFMPDGDDFSEMSKQVIADIMAYLREAYKREVDGIKAPEDA